MADIKISEMTTAATLNGTEVSVLSQSQGGQLVSVKATLQAIANWFAVNAEYTSALNTTDKRICGAINELKQLISLIPQFSIEVVQVLPTEDISDTTIYLVPAEDPEVGNYYEEYIHVNNAWELVGTTAVDLSGYYTKVESDGKFAVTISNTISPTTTTKKVADIEQNNVTTPVYADDADAILRAAFGEHTATGNPVSVDAFLGLEVASECKVTMLPIQDLSHGDPSPTNICPISGRDSLYLNNSGENLINGLESFKFLRDTFYSTKLTIDETAKTAYLVSTASGYYGLLQNTTKGQPTYYPFKPNTQYTFIFKATKNSGANNLNSGVSYTDGTPSRSFTTSDQDSDGYVVFTNPANTSVKSLYIGTYSANVTFYYETFCIMEGVRTKSDWVAQNKTTHTATFSNTVYGGTYDFTTGKLTLTNKFISIDGSDWTGYPESEGKFHCGSVVENNEAKQVTSGTEYISDMYKFAGNGSSASTAVTTDKRFYGQRGLGRFWVLDSTYANDLSGFKAMLNTTPLQVCYPLTTPIEIDLTTEDITLLKGVNVLSTDGDSLELKYSADIKAYIDSKLNA